MVEGTNVFAPYTTMLINFDFTWNEFLLDGGESFLGNLQEDHTNYSCIKA